MLACLLVVYYKAMEPGSTAYMQRSKKQYLSLVRLVMFSQQHRLKRFARTLVAQ